MTSKKPSLRDGGREPRLSCGTSDEPSWAQTSVRQTLGDREIISIAAALSAVVERTVALDRPVDIRQWCDAASVKLEWIRSPEEGHYARWNSVSTVRIRPGGSDVRRNFTVAHELGHHFLEEGRTNPAFRRHLPNSVHRSLARLEVGGTDEERISDAFASCILMPAQAVSALVGDRQLTLSFLRAIADEFHVSPSAAVIRLNRLHLSSAAYVRCEPIGSGWEILQWAGGCFDLRRRTLLRIPSADRTEGPTDALLFSPRKQAVQVDMDQRADGFCIALLTPYFCEHR